MNPLPDFVLLSADAHGTYHGQHHGADVTLRPTGGRFPACALELGAGETVVGLALAQKGSEDDPWCWAGQGPHTWLEAAIPMDLQGYILLVIWSDGAASAREQTDFALTGTTATELRECAAAAEDAESRVWLYAFAHARLRAQERAALALAQRWRAEAAEVVAALTHELAAVEDAGEVQAARELVEKPTAAEADEQAV